MFTLITYNLTVNGNVHPIQSVYLTFESEVVLDRLSRDSRVDSIKTIQYKTLTDAKETLIALRKGA